MKDTMCVYRIVNNKNGHLYVGSTLKGFNWRKRKHLRELKNQKHHNRHLQNAYNLYGEKHFLFEILETVSNPKILLRKEQFWTNKLKPQYNVMKDIKSHIGVKRSQETRRKISMALTGKHLSDETKKKLRDANLGKKQSEETIVKRMRTMYKPILQMDKNGIIIKRWKSATHAAKALGLSLPSIYRCVRGNRYTYKKFRWKKYN